MDSVELPEFEDFKTRNSKACTAQNWSRASKRCGVVGALSRRRWFPRRSGGGFSLVLYCFCQSILQSFEVQHAKSLTILQRSEVVSVSIAARVVEQSAGIGAAIVEVPQMGFCARADDHSLNAYRIPPGRHLGLHSQCARNGTGLSLS